MLDLFIDLLDLKGFCSFLIFLQIYFFFFKNDEKYLVANYFIFPRTKG